MNYKILPLSGPYWSLVIQRISLLIFKCDHNILTSPLHQVLIKKEWLCLEWNDRNVWKKTFVARIQEYVRRRWRKGFGINEREQEYVHMKSQPKNRNMQMAVWERE